MNGNGHDHEAAKAAPDNTADLTVAVAGLAALDPLEYDRRRTIAAERLGVRVSALDEAVKQARPKRDDEPASGGGRPLSLPVTEAWPDPVDGAAVLQEVSALISRYLALLPGVADVVALWIAFTHVFDAFAISPRLAITSPEKRCGKTTLMRLLAMLCERALQAANITPAAVFRTIEVARPTLLIDEADTFLEKNEETRGVLNAGHARDGSVIRTVGEDHEPRQFSTWSPCAIAIIGRLPDTLADRSIPVAMRRRTADEQIERLRFDQPGMFADVRRRLARFTSDARSVLEIADPEMPAYLHDRAADNWRVVFAIADAAGGDWPNRVRNACAALNAGIEAEADTLGVSLLRDIRTAFSEKHDAPKLSSAELCEMLAADEASSWVAFGRSEKPITPNALARLLKRFQIAPKTMREGVKIWRGYERETFTDAWSRYLPQETPPQSATPLQPLRDNGFSHFDNRNGSQRVAPADADIGPEIQGMLRCSGSAYPAAPDQHQVGVVEETL